MYRGKGHISDKLALAIIWAVALAFLFLFFQKLKILFH